MSDRYYSRFTDDLRRTRYDAEELDRDLERKHQERGVKQARPGQPWYNEPTRHRYDYDRDREGAEQSASWLDRGQERLSGDWNEQEWREHRRQGDAEWWAPGPYEGLGPRGYRRSDQAIKDDICDLLTRHGLIDAREIELEIKEGEVTLEGRVRDRQMKYLAEDVADSVPGVFDVHNRLQVG